MNDCEKLLLEIAETMERWASESLKGGWSTHQVKPQEILVDRIYAYFGRKHVKDAQLGTKTKGRPIRD